MGIIDVVVEERDVDVGRSLWCGSVGNEIGSCDGWALVEQHNNGLEQRGRRCRRSSSGRVRVRVGEE